MVEIELVEILEAVRRPVLNRVVLRIGGKIEIPPPPPPPTFVKPEPSPIKLVAYTVPALEIS